MHLEALNIFCDVVRYQSFSRGAVANSVSQSAASQAIRQIEKQLSAQLIDRSKRPWQLTPEGRLFFKGCQEIVERYHELQEAVQHRQHPAVYTVRLASIYSVQLHDLSPYIDQFHASVPGASVDLEYMHPDQIYARVPERSVGSGTHLLRQSWTCADGYSVAEPGNGGRVSTEPPLRPAG